MKVETRVEGRKFVFKTLSSSRQLKWHQQNYLCDSGDLPLSGHLKWLSRSCNAIESQLHLCSMVCQTAGTWCLEFSSLWSISKHQSQLLFFSGLLNSSKMNDRLTLTRRTSTVTLPVIINKLDYNLQRESRFSFSFMLCNFLSVCPVNTVDFFVFFLTLLPERRYDFAACGRRSELWSVGMI